MRRQSERPAPVARLWLVCVDVAGLVWAVDVPAEVDPRAEGRPVGQIVERDGLWYGWTTDGRRTGEAYVSAQGAASSVVALAAGNWQPRVIA